MAIAFSHQGSAQGAAGTTSLPVSITINPGDTVVVFVFSATVITTFGISDDGGNSYTNPVSVGTSQLFVGLKVANAATTVTLTHTAADYSIVICTYTGVGSLGTTASDTFSFVNSETISKTITADNSFIVAEFGWQKGAAVSASGVTGNVRASATATTTLNGVVGMDNTAASSGSSVTNAVNFSGSVAGIVIAIELKPPATSGVLVNNSLHITNSLQKTNSVQVTNSILVTTGNTWIPD